jgi:thymidylate kinase
MAKRAAFIVIEGLDRSGKSTQVALLRDLLEASEKPVKVLKFPGQQFLTTIPLSLITVWWKQTAAPLPGS